MSDYTPTTEQMRSAWILKRWDSIGQLRSEGSDAEVDRWLAAHDAATRTAAQAQAWDRGACFAFSDCTYTRQGILEQNPYRTVTDKETQ